MVDDSRNFDVPLRYQHRRRPFGVRYQEEFRRKDFGTIFPGHGGIMDRFDSYSFVMPMLYAIISLILSVGA